MTLTSHLELTCQSDQDVGEGDILQVTAPYNVTGNMDQYGAKIVATSGGICKNVLGRSTLASDNKEECDILSRSRWR